MLAYIHALIQLSVSPDLNFLVQILSMTCLADVCQQRQGHEESLWDRSAEYEVSLNSSFIQTCTLVYSLVHSLTPG
jgi:hypothetical protein